MPIDARNNPNPALPGFITINAALGRIVACTYCQSFYGTTGGVGDGVFRGMKFAPDGQYHGTDDQEPRAEYSESYYEFSNFPNFLSVSGHIDDLFVVSPAPVSGGNFSISAENGFMVMPNWGSINGGCCVDNAPRSFTVSIGGASYTPSASDCGEGEDGLSFEKVQSELGGAFFLMNKYVFEDGGWVYTDCKRLGYPWDELPKMENTIISKAQLQALGFTGAKLRIYAGISGCGGGRADVTFTGCPFVKWRACRDCEALEFTGLIPEITDEPMHGWENIAGNYFCVTDSLTPPDYPDAQPCYAKVIATYNCFEEDPALRWVVGFAGQYDPVATTYGWTPYNNNNPDLGYRDGGTFECVIASTEDESGNPIWELPDPPTTPPNCYCNWYAYYNCGTETWSVNLESCYATHVDAENVNQWVGTGAYRTMVSTSNSEPTPPSNPTCVAYWEAYWNGPTWQKYSWGSDVGEVTGWTCSGAEYASGTFEIGVTPTDPVCE